MSLTDTAIRNAKPLGKPYKLSDAQGLYLLIKPNGSKLWCFKYRVDSKEKKLAFGAYPATSLASARQQRDSARTELSEGIDPSLKKQREKQIRQNGTTFEEVARSWHASKTRWSEAHADKVLRSLELHAFPRVGNIHIADISTADLLTPLRAPESKGHLEVAMRLKQRFTSIMRYAVQKHLIKSNPGLDLDGAIEPPTINHHPALPLERLPELLQRIENYRGGILTRLAVQLTLLVFIRSSELRFARWEEIDFKKRMWAIPVSRKPIKGVRFSTRGTKMKTPHLVPLSTQAIRILEQLQTLSGDLELIFPGYRDPTHPISENTINKALRIIGYDTKKDVCGHGFRTMACSALSESGLWSRDAVDKQMSHQERNGVRAAYIHKAEFLKERGLMMQWWGDYLDANHENYIDAYQFSGSKTK
ncbi:Prophage CP4-57 integrase [Serratia fonticola]|uniref:tyrosine-type recombinase/integrase n=1 Tax=Serratia fonticola TaxID=47917 RepID=UPI002179BD99|nr:integrase arm-type DNA-binding domain-containing protein [Serratia fonticola]CAI1580550.1 Prophage CP4-57 integrase [Serratia fonticola]